MDADPIGSKIKRRREFLRLRQEDLSELSGVTTKTIHLIETGSGNPSLHTLQKIIAVLGMEMLVQVKQNGNG